MNLVEELAQVEKLVTLTLTFPENGQAGCLPRSGEGFRGPSELHGISVL
jgi:hypothetical protein